MAPSLLAISTVPSVVMLLAFYSVAIHMRLALGELPGSIGTRGFPEALVAHGEISYRVWQWILGASAFAVPVGMLVCVVVPRLRRFARYLLLHEVFVGVALFLMCLAPERFRDWWGD